jgi:mRNA-degrading endonuclease RelE of RelBE toxin-antitoxin system
VLEFVESQAFTKRLIALAKAEADDVLLEIQNDLLQDPERGDVVRGTSGVRKSRASDPTRGKGKRGGFRYMYYYLERDGRIFLLMVFSKDEQLDLTKDQKKVLVGFVKDLKENRE